MKLIIKGNPYEIARVMTIIGEGLSSGSKPVANIISDLKKEIDKVTADNAPKESIAATQTESTTPPALYVSSEGTKMSTAPAPAPAPEKKKRRTKEQIAADNAIDPADRDQPEETEAAVTEPSKATEIDREELKDFVLKRVEEDPANAAKIRAKLTTLGATRAGELKDDQLNGFWVFLQQL